MDSTNAIVNPLEMTKETEFEVTVIREAGLDPMTGTYLGQARETLKIYATNRQEVYKKSLFLTKIPFRGQLRRTLIDGQEHLDEVS